MYRVLSRTLAATTPMILAVTLCSAARADPPTFEDNAQKAVDQVAPDLKAAPAETVKTASDVDPAQKVTTEAVTFRAAGTSLMTFRAVGAIEPVENGTATERGATTTMVRRAKVGNRRILIVDTSNSLGPGQLIAYWTERTGVNYVVAWRTAELDRKALIKLIKAFPADDTKPSQRALRAIKNPPKRAKATERSASSKYVDGVGQVYDDLNDEAALCKGCSYAGSNYVAWYQRILSADGYTPVGGFDCWFGTNTVNATKTWQRDHGLTQDGTFNAASRSRVGQALISVNDTKPGPVWYNGWSWQFWFQRDGKYTVDGKYLGYTYITLC